MVAADFNVRLLMLGSKGWMAMKPSLIIVVMLKDTFNQHADDFIAYMTYIYNPTPSQYELWNGYHMFIYPDGIDDITIIWYV